MKLPVGEDHPWYVTKLKEESELRRNPLRFCGDRDCHRLGITKLEDDMRSILCRCGRVWSTRVVGALK